VTYSLPRSVSGPRKPKRFRGPVLPPGRKFEPTELQAARALIYHRRPWLAPAFEETRNVVLPASRWPVGMPPTAAMDVTGRMVWHEDFMKSLTTDMLAGVMVHELSHLLGRHPWRRGERDWRIWNTACDAVINGEITGSADFKLPEEGVFGSKLGIEGLDDQAEGWTAEMVYDALVDKIEENPDVEVGEEGVRVREGVVVGVIRGEDLEKVVTVIKPPELSQIANSIVVVKMVADQVEYTIGPVEGDISAGTVEYNAPLIEIPVMNMVWGMSIQIGVGDIRSHDGVFIAQTDNQGEPVDLLAQVVEPDMDYATVLGKVEDYRFVDVIGLYMGTGGESGQMDIDGIPVPTGDVDPQNSSATGGPEHPAGKEADETETERGEPPTGEIPDWTEIGEEVQDLKDWYDEERKRQERLKSRGTEPGGAYRGVDPRVARINRETRTALRKIIGRHGPLVPGQGVWSYARPSRRQSLANGDDLIMPAPRARQQKVAMVIDTSGSVDDDLLKAAVGQTMAVTAATGVPAVAVPCDAEVQGVIPATSVKRVIQGLIGGGGTDMVVGMEQARELDPDLIIVVTDMGTPWPDEPFDVPVLILTDEPKGGWWGEAPDWATVVFIDTKE